MSHLSSTTLTQYLKGKNFQGLCQQINEHFECKPSDCVSALKVVKTLAWYFYDHSVVEQDRADVVNCAALAAKVVRENETMDAVFKEVVSSLVFIVDRLQKVDKDLMLVSSLSPVIYSVLTTSPIKLTSLSNSMYVTLWNFTISIGSSVKTEKEQLALIDVWELALLFQMYDHGSESFSHSKLCSKIKNFSKSLSTKLETLKCKEVLVNKLTSFLQSPVFSQADQLIYWELWTFSLELCFKFNLKSFCDTIIACQTKFSLETVQMTKLLKEIVFGGLKSCTDLAISSLNDSDVQFFFKILIERSECMEHLRSMKNQNTSGYNSVTDSICKMCEQSNTKATVLFACKVLSLLESLETENGINAESIHCIRKLVTAHDKLMHWLLNNNTDSLSSLLNKYTAELAKIGGLLISSSELGLSLEFLGLSCSWSQTLLDLDPTFSHYVLFSRYKIKADVELNEKEYWNSLLSLINAAVYLFSSQHEHASAKFSEMSSALVLSRVKWMKMSQENKENVKDDQQSLSSKPDTTCSQPDGQLEKSEATLLDISEAAGLKVPRSVQSSLLVYEVSCYRQKYLEGTDLHSVAVRCLDQILEIDKTQINMALVLMEQAWMIWYQSDVDQLETALKCCLKASSILTRLEENLYVGINYFLRFLLEHRILQLQIKIEVEEEEKRIVLEGRKEREGVERGCDVMEDDGRPLYTGLTMTTQDKLTSFLEASLQAFCKHNYTGGPGMWYTVKDILDVQLALSYYLEFFNKQSYKLLENMLSLADSHHQTDHVVHACARMHAHNPADNQACIVKLSEMSTSISDKTSSAPLLYQVSLVVATHYLNLKRYDECEEILDEILMDPYTNTHSDKAVLISAEGHYLAALLRYRNRKPISIEQTSNKDASYARIGSLGPLELALEAFKLITGCTSFINEDRILPCRQSPRMMWLQPKIADLTVRIADLLVTLHHHIGAPRELKAFVKEGLKYCQTFCLPLHSCHFLIELAKSQLLCDDDRQAFIQLQGVRDILGDILKSGHKNKAENLSDDDDDIFLLKPGSEHGRSASPSLFRNNIEIPSFADDDSSCTCASCVNPLLARVCLSFSNSWARALLMTGESRAGRLAFQTCHNLARKLERKLDNLSRNLKTDHNSEVVTFQQTVLENLVDECESLAYSGDMEMATQIAESIKFQKEEQNKEGDVIVNPRTVNLNPSLVFRIIELQASLRCVKKNQTTGVDSLLASMNLLKISQVMSQFQGQSTPVISKVKRETSKAPVKKVFPSLGVGDAAHLAKELNKLKMFSEETEGEEEEETVIPVKSKKVVWRKKMTNLDALIDNTENVMPTKPKITFTAETPAKTLPLKGSTPKLSVKSAKSLSRKSSPKKSGKKTSEKCVTIYEDAEKESVLTPAKKLNVESEPLRTRGTRSTKKKETLVSETNSRSTKKKDADETSSEGAAVKVRKSSRSAAKRL